MLVFSFAGAPLSVFQDAARAVNLLYCRSPRNGFFKQAQPKKISRFATVFHLRSSVSEIVSEPNSENCLDLICAAPPCEKGIVVPDTNYITSATRKFMLDMPGPGSFQGIV